MKKYRIVKNVYDWIGNAPVDDVENVIIGEEELARLSKGWDIPIEKLMRDLEEVEEEE